MVLQRVNSKLTKQNDTEKKPNPTTAAVQRGRSSNLPKQNMRSKDRATNVSIRDVNLDCVKLMEPKWRSTKYEKITMVDGDQQNAIIEERNAPALQRKFTLQDFIVSGIRSRLSAKWRKRIGMHTSAYIVIPKQLAVVAGAEVGAGLREPTVAPVIEEQEEEEPVAFKVHESGSRSEVEFTETLDDDDFIIVNVH